MIRLTNIQIILCLISSTSCNRSFLIKILSMKITIKVKDIYLKKQVLFVLRYTDECICGYFHGQNLVSSF